ncbi:MAG TPA: hypothetical protein VNT27_02480 [Propionibacteriaceae bacterium]|nr:hypothetical protein [Propionibacteriaceae bacterium]
MRSWSTADLNLVGHNEIRSAMSARSRRRATSIACATSAKRRDLGAHYGTDITRQLRRAPPLL